jgi:hypothetical protein
MGLATKRHKNHKGFTESLLLLIEYFLCLFVADKAN